MSNHIEVALVPVDTKITGKIHLETLGQTQMLARELRKACKDIKRQSIVKRLLKKLVTLFSIGLLNLGILERIVNLTEER